MCWRQLSLSLRVARFSEKGVSESHVLMVAMSQCLGSSLWREGSIRGSCFGWVLGSMLWLSVMAQCYGRWLRGENDFWDPFFFVLDVTENSVLGDAYPSCVE